MRMKLSGEGKSVLFSFVTGSTLFGFFAVAYGLEPVIDSGSYLSPDHHLFLNRSGYLLFLDDIFNYLSENGNVSEKCLSDTSQLLSLIRNGDTNALKWYDSNGTPIPGMLEGGVFFIGYYSQCVHSLIQRKDESSLRGQYCLVNLDFSNSSNNEFIPEASWLILTQSKKPPTIAVCMPSTCTEEELGNAVAQSLSIHFETVKGKVSLCHGDVTGLSSDVGAVSFLVIFSIFCTIAFVATAYDFFVERKISVDNAAKTVSTELLCEKSNKEPGIFLRCLLAFSFKTNARKIFSVGGGGENIRSLHGLKFLSMVLIILGHTYSFATQNVYFQNPGVAFQAPKGFVAQVFANGTLAVDTFYLISGVLVAYVVLKGLEKTSGKLPLLWFYFHRYFRLTPLMMMVIFFCACLLRYIGSGPNWLATIQMYDAWCKDNFWTNALYLHNFINSDTMCLSHTWYLATDMQFYLVVPLILIPLFKNLKYGLVSMLVFLMATTIATAVITAINHLPAIPYTNDVLPLELVNKYYREVYIKPYCRMGPYIIGIAVGYFLLHKKELVLKKKIVALLWFLNVLFGLVIIYLMWPANQGKLPSNSEAAAYSALARTAWAVTLGWLTIACVYGYGVIYLPRKFVPHLCNLHLFIIAV
ncbi:nose resistant to fluoxetine protein 6-like isoform X2 [Uloborus diversus]|uniref:nose resistant to fluoxetine protein 6-like isoform X2 n=1 Tax=Uloborus diversus TaxID=327109 RepID=UPI002409290D|nr:nose resistant to fluoxetine protein 6-like isoform X2 [Uloborus diversus]